MPPAFRRLALADDEDGAEQPDEGAAAQKLWLMLAAATLDRGGDDAISEDEAQPDRLASRINVVCARAAECP